MAPSQSQAWEFPYYSDVFPKRGKKKKERERCREDGEVAKKRDRHRDDSRGNRKESEIEEKIQNVGKCCSRFSRVQVTHLGERE